MNTLTRHVKVQLLVFTVLTTIGLVTLGWYYLRLPSEVGIGQYTLYADLPGSGGLYTRANVTYRGCLRRGRARCNAAANNPTRVSTPRLAAPRTSTAHRAVR